MEDCIFCKIVKGDIPSVKVYEDEEFIVIQSKGQVSKGHSLIIPKEHSEDVLSFDTKLGCKTFSLIQKIGNATMTGLKADGFHVVINAKPIASHVKHTHVHVIPRYYGDGLEPMPEKDGNEEEMVLAAQKLIKEL